MTKEAQKVTSCRGMDKEGKAWLMKPVLAWLWLADPGRGRNVTKLWVGYLISSTVKLTHITSHHDNCNIVQ